MAGTISQGRNYDTIGRTAAGYQGFGAVREHAPDAFNSTINQIFGPSANIHATTVVNDLDAVQTSAHGTTGIPYAISGTAKVVQMDVAQRLVGYSDPIKAIMGIGVHREQKILIKRQYVAGGGAGIVPERAPARTVAIQEDAREVMLTRYGGDIEFNMNLLMRPEDAKREMGLKLAAQERGLEEALTNIGYDVLLSEGTNLVSAIVRSNHLLHGGGVQAGGGGGAPRPPGGLDMVDHAERIYMTSVFGAMNKFPFPVHNLLAAAKKAAAYDVSRANKTVMILPHGLPELLKFTRPETMIYSVSGAGPDKIDMKLEGGYTDPSTNCTIFTHIPPASNLHGAAHPVAQRSSLSGDVTIAFYHTDAELANMGGKVFDWGNYQLADEIAGTTVVGVPENVPEGGAQIGNGTPSVLTVMTLSMSSAILSVPGGSVGELLVGYPSTALSTNASTESGRMQLRCYLGAALYKPEDVLILPDIAFEGIKKVVHYRCDSHTVAGRGGIFVVPRDDFEDTNRGTEHGLDDFAGLTVDHNGVQVPGVVIKAYPRALFTQTGDVRRTNGGHLGVLDGPTHYTKVFGTQTYDAGLQPLTHIASSAYP